MGWLKSLFLGDPRKAGCAVCGGYVDSGTGSGRGVTIVMGVNPRNSPTLGLFCNDCKLNVHYRCAKTSKWEDEWEGHRETYTHILCPKCNKTLTII